MNEEDKSLVRRPSLLPFNIRTLRGSKSMESPDDSLSKLLEVNIGEKSNMEELRLILKAKTRAVLSQSFSKEELQKMKEELKNNCVRLGIQRVLFLMRLGGALHWILPTIIIW